MTAIYCLVIFLVYLPGLLFIAKSKTIGRYPIPLFCFLGLFVFNAAGSVIVLTKEYSYSGVYLVNIEYVWMLVLQPLIFYMICGPYIRLRCGYSVELKGDKADRPFSVIVIFAILAVLWLYRQEVGHFLIFELLAGNVHSQSVLAYRQAFSYGLENFTYYRIGLVVLPAILLAHTLLVCLAKRSFDLGSVGILAFCVLLPTILAEKSMFLPMAVIAA